MPERLCMNCLFAKIRVEGLECVYPIPKVPDKAFVELLPNSPFVIPEGGSSCPCWEADTHREGGRTPDA